MSLAELLPEVRSLSTPEKLRLIQILAKDLESADTLVVPGAEYPIWSPHDSYEAAATMLDFLRHEGATE